jgi:SAM-dependent methyltransferase
MAPVQQERPSSWVSRFAPLVTIGKVLDLACGGGRHARWMAGLGHQVLAVDRDATVLAGMTAEGVNTLQFDLEADDATDHPDWPLKPAVWDGVIVTHYLHRPLMPALLRSLAAGGVLIYETFAAGNGQFGKPSNPDFLLAPGELLDLVAGDPGLRVIAFEDGYISAPRPAMIQRICVRRIDNRAVPSSLAL